METVNLHQWYWFPVTGPDYPGIGHYVIVDADGTTLFTSDYQQHLANREKALNSGILNSGR